MYRGEGEMTGVTSQRSHQLDEETVEMEIHHRRTAPPHGKATVNDFTVLDEEED